MFQELCSFDIFKSFCNLKCIEICIRTMYKLFRLWSKVQYPNLSTELSTAGAQINLVKPTDCECKSVHRAQRVDPRAECGRQHMVLVPFITDINI